MGTFALTETHSHALIIGAGCAGLLAASALAPYFSRVTIIDQDAAPDDDVFAVRRSTPQSQHAHHLLFEGKRVIDMLYPGFSSAFVGRGGKQLDFGADFRFFQSGRWRRPRRLGVPMYLGMREMMEGAMRDGLAAHRNVSLEWSTKADALIVESGRCVGATLDRNGQQETVSADLVIDATGRWSKLGDAAPRRFTIDVWYTTFLLATRFAHAPDWSVLIGYNKRPEQRVACYAGFTAPGESILQFTIMSYGLKPPTQFEDCIEFLRHEAPSPLFADLLASGTPIKPPTRLAFPSMDWSPSPLATNVIRIGDAACSVDPVTGVGVTKAALEAELLSKLLASETPLNEIGAAFDKGARRLRKRAWDFLYEQNSRFTVSGSALARRYMDRVMDLAQDGDGIFKTFVKVRNLVTPMAAFYHPSIAARVLLSAFSNRPPDEDSTPVLPPTSGSEQRQTAASTMSSR